MIFDNRYAAELEKLLQREDYAEFHGVRLYWQKGCGWNRKLFYRTVKSGFPEEQLYCRL